MSRFAFYQYDDDTIYLSSLFIRESDRGRGYGSKVLKAAEEVAKTFGISKIRLKVENNTWMEEDEYRVKTILYLLHEVADNHNFDEWLKSIKERVQSQPMK